MMPSTSPGPDEDRDLYTTSDGREVGHEELSDGEQSYYGDDNAMNHCDIGTYVDNFNRDQSGLSCDDEGNWTED